MEIICYRDPELARESRFLPAATYNLAHTLLARSTNGCVFVPIRTMQYLAVLDAEEFVFIDGARKCWVDIAWREFHPQLRNALDEPVPYQALYYRPDSVQLMSRLQAELPRALRELAGKKRLDVPAQILKFPAPG